MAEVQEYRYNIQYQISSTLCYQPMKFSVYHVIYVNKTFSPLMSVVDLLFLYFVVYGMKLQVCPKYGAKFYSLYQGSHSMQEHCATT